MVMVLIWAFAVGVSIHLPWTATFRRNLACFQGEIGSYTGQTAREIDLWAANPYLLRHVGVTRSYPISLADPPASPGGLGAFAPVVPRGSSHFRSDQAATLTPEEKP